MTPSNQARLRRTSGYQSTRRCCVLLWAACSAWIAASAPSLAARPPAEVTLDGEWFFALDPLRRGEEHGWNLAPADWSGDGTLVLKNWDRVVTPHDYLSDPRYEWTGVAWYRRLVSVPELADGEVCRLCFDRVSSKCEVWVNGKRAGGHVGGYSPFEIDVTRHVKADAFNHVAVKVDNSWVIGDVPGPRMGDDPTHQMYVWRNYGGLLRSAAMVVSPAVYVKNQKVETKASPSTHDIDVTAKVFLRNGSKSSRSVRVNVAISAPQDREGFAASLFEGTPVEVTVPAEGTATAVLIARLPKAAVRLWSVDSPHLYACRATARGGGNRPEHSHVASFGIRTVRVNNGSFLLNDTPVRLAGANRVEGHPRFGGLEPAELVDLDLRMMKSAHFELQRLQHYPLSEDILDWADRHGMLVIAEAPCWGLTPPELSDERYRENFRRQLVEMIEASWNHPSVIGWSVGNEYHAWTPEGADWTKTFIDLVHRLDPTRPATYAALGYDASQPTPSKEARGMHWVDFVSVNYYTSGEGAGKALDKIHAMWPEKPILISEYGKRTDQDSEAKRIRHFRDTLAAVRKRDFVMGMSYWSFNDYRSRYPGGDSTGHRPWGIVTADRKPRELYHVMQSELSPALLTVVQASPLRVRVEARADFPTRPLTAPLLEVSNARGDVVESIVLADVRPGEPIDAECEAVSADKVRLLGANGHVLAELVVSESEPSTSDSAN
ncbi:MAG: glycoside hydrolase family 2 protein [Lacipirellulaceae bacterium]